MKKIFTLVCAMVTAFCANAAEEMMAAPQLLSIAELQSAPLPKKAMTEAQTIELNATNMKVSDASAEFKAPTYVFEASNADYNMQIIVASTTPVGTFSFENFTINTSYTWIKKGTSVIAFVSGSLTCTEDEQAKTMALKGSLVGKDGNTYNFNLSCKTGGLDKDSQEDWNVKFNFTEMSWAISGDTALITCTNLNLQRMVLMLYVPDGSEKIPAGTYDFSVEKEIGKAQASKGKNEKGGLTFSLAGNCVYQNNQVLFKDMWFIVGGSVTISYDENNKMKVELAGKNSYDYNVTATVAYEKLTPKGTVDVVATNMAAAQQSGKVLVNAWNSNYNFMLYLNGETIEGDYTIDDLVSGSYIQTLTSEMLIYDAEFSITMNGKDMTLTGWVLASDTVQYNLQFSGYYGALTYDSKDDLETSFDLDAAKIQTQKVGTSSAIILQVANGQYVFAVAFMAELDSEGNIPAGTYTIDNTMAAGTVLASSGYNSQYGPQASFVGEINGTQYTGKFWFMEGGTVKVDEDGDILVEAVNSLDKNVKVTVTTGATGLFQINAIAPKLNKIMLNGHVVIFKNNKAYNLMGAEL